MAEVQNKTFSREEYLKSDLSKLSWFSVTDDMFTVGEELHIVKMFECIVKNTESRKLQKFYMVYHTLQNEPVYFVTNKEEEATKMYSNIVDEFFDIGNILTI